MLTLSGVEQCLAPWGLPQGTPRDEHGSESNFPLALPSSPGQEGTRGQVPSLEKEIFSPVLVSWGSDVSLPPHLSIVS